MWRRIVACVLATLSLAAGAADGGDALAPDRTRDFLSPQGFIVGGFSAPAAPAPGQPPTGPYIKLMYPAALAANGPDLYVADGGRRLLLRIDTTSQAVTPLREVPPLPGVRVKTGPDGSVYLLRPDRGEVVRLTRDGRNVAVLGAKYDILQPADIVIEPTLNRPWISDAAGGVFSFHPSGRVSEPLVGRGDGFADESGGATLLAASRERVVGVDPRCRCVLEFDREGMVVGRFGEGQLVNPADLAIDAHGRTWIVDRGDRRLKVFENGQLVAALEPARLGLVDVTAISIDIFRAYVSDGPGGRIGIFGVVPPTRR